jgi:hypothetical protein
VEVCRVDVAVRSGLLPGEELRPNASLTKGQTTLRLLETAGLRFAMAVRGSGIAEGSKIVAIAGNRVTLSKPALASGSGVSLFVSGGWIAPTQVDFTAELRVPVGLPVQRYDLRKWVPAGGATGAELQWSLLPDQDLPAVFSVDSAGVLAVESLDPAITGRRDVYVQAVDGAGKRVMGRLRFTPLAFEKEYFVDLSRSSGTAVELNTLLIAGTPGDSTRAWRVMEESTPGAGRLELSPAGSFAFAPAGAAFCEFLLETPGDQVDHSPVHALIRIRSVAPVSVVVSTADPASPVDLNPYLDATERSSPVAWALTPGAPLPQEASLKLDAGRVSVVQGSRPAPVAFYVDAHISRTLPGGGTAAQVRTFSVVRQVRDLEIPLQLDSTRASTFLLDLASARIPGALGALRWEFEPRQLPVQRSGWQLTNGRVLRGELRDAEQAAQRTPLLLRASDGVREFFASVERRVLEPVAVGALEVEAGASSDSSIEVDGIAGVPAGVGSWRLVDLAGALPEGMTFTARGALSVRVPASSAMGVYRVYVERVPGSSDTATGSGASRALVRVDVSVRNGSGVLVDGVTVWEGSAVAQLASIEGVQPGMTLRGAGVPEGTRVLSLDAAARQLTLSAPATLSLSGIFWAATGLIRNPPEAPERPLPVGAEWTFRVSPNPAFGAVAFQWRKGGVKIEGANGASLPLGPLKARDAGIYDVVVSSGSNSAVSAPVSLAVADLQVDSALFESQTRKLVPEALSRLTLEVVLTRGLPPFTYRWYRDDLLIRSETSPAFFDRLSAAGNASPDNAPLRPGAYRVEVSDTWGNPTVKTATALVELVDLPSVAGLRIQRTGGSAKPILGGAVELVLQRSGVPFADTATTV